MADVLCGVLFLRLRLFFFPSIVLILGMSRRYQDGFAASFTTFVLRYDRVSMPYSYAWQYFVARGYEGRAGALQRFAAMCHVISKAILQVFLTADAARLASSNNLWGGGTCKALLMLLQSYEYS